MIRTIETILVKPAGPDCNAACDYCFYLPVAEAFDGRRHRMDRGVLETLIRKVMEQAGERVAFVWQGGEPTLMGLEFFEEVVALQQRYAGGPVTVGNAIQTNGLLLDRRWVHFLEKWRFLVGLSLDGPEEIHDARRMQRNGRGTWRRTVDRLRLLLGAGVAVHGLVVVDSLSVRNPDAIYDFLKEQGLVYQQYVPCAFPEAFAPSPEDYGRFLVRLHTLWSADHLRGRPTTSVRNIDNVNLLAEGRPPPECTVAHTCGSNLVVEHDGSVHSCDFAVDPAAPLGNVLKDHIEDMLTSHRQRSFGAAKADLPDRCRICEHLHLCRGGCHLHRGPDRVNRYCVSYRMLYESVLTSKP
jgi:uncharacterized protein